MLNCDVCGYELGYNIICPHCGFDNGYQFVKEENVSETITIYYDTTSTYLDEDVLFETIFEIFGTPRYIVNRIISGKT